VGVSVALVTIQWGCGGDAGDGLAPSGETAGESAAATTRLQPSDVSYLGAFRLPGGEDRPATFAYGGNAMTFHPAGDPGGSGDGFPGSLFITGHDRLAYGEMPNGSQIAEVTIPAPSVAGSVDGLPSAEFVQPFADAAQGLFVGLDEIPRIGLQYLDAPATGPRLHLAWGQHFQEAGDLSHAMLSTTVASPDARGPWGINAASLYSVNGYLFDIPADWADANASGRRLATGRFRDGGWSGKGPALYAYQPWDSGGSLAAPGSLLDATTLLLYESSESNESVTEGVMTGYQHPDEWEGGAWVTTASGKAAVVFAGTKGTGAKFWYGWVNPQGPELPCIETGLLGQFTLCWNADGTPCPESDLGGCEGHNDFRGWWSSSFAAQLIFYDPAELAQVAAGSLAPSGPQPYASLDIDAHLFLTAEQVEPEMLGRGVQRRARIGAAAFDRDTGRLYVLELFADGAKPVVHVFGVS
jgi:hypothetical protein